MVHAWKVGGFAVALVFGVACGSAGPDESDPTGGPSLADGEAFGAASNEEETATEGGEDGEIEAPEALTSDPVTGEASSEARDAVGDDAEGGRTKICQAVCDVTKLRSSAECPATIVGHGKNTGLFPGCARACARAKTDAEKKLGSLPDCVLGACTTSGC